MILSSVFKAFLSFYGTSFWYMFRVAGVTSFLVVWVAVLLCPFQLYASHSGYKVFNYFNIHLFMGIFSILSLVGSFQVVGVLFPSFLACPQRVNFSGSLLGLFLGEKHLSSQKLLHFWWLPVLCMVSFQSRTSLYSFIVLSDKVCSGPGSLLRCEELVHSAC